MIILWKCVAAFVAQGFVLGVPRIHAITRGPLERHHRDAIPPLCPCAAKFNAHLFAVKAVEAGLSVSCLYIRRFPIHGGTPKSSIDGIFQYKPSSYWGAPIYGNLHITCPSCANSSTCLNWTGFCWVPLWLWFFLFCGWLWWYFWQE